MFEAIVDAGLVDAMTIACRAESAAIAHRLAAVGELDARRARDLAESILWRTDPHEEVTAEVSAAINISRARASTQLYHARALRDRLPQVAAVFSAGVIDYQLVMTIIARTDNVDDAIMARLDAALARHCVKWMRLSVPKLRDRIDAWVVKYDPDGVRVPPKVDDNRYVDIGPTQPGMAGIWANIHAPDAAALGTRLDALADSVCDNDPRTREQRRADACGAVGRGEDTLACQCGSDECPATAKHNAAATVVIHVLAEQATLDATSDTPGYLPGFGILPAESVRDIAESTQHKPLTVPTDTEPEPGYRPSAGLAEFIRWRDLTCRWPGCDQPAERADIDHTVPYPAGATHPSNTKAYCRTHHLVKTFYTGRVGWTDQQLPDGTVVFTAPTGHTYTTEPHGATLFPALAQPTGELTAPDTDEPSTGRTCMMPTRRQTREQDRQDRITAERRQRAELIAEEERQRQAWLTTNYQPPPF